MVETDISVESLMFLTSAGNQEYDFAWCNSSLDTKSAPKYHVYIKDGSPHLSDENSTTSSATFEISTFLSDHIMSSASMNSDTSSTSSPSLVALSRTNSMTSAGGLSDALCAPLECTSGEVELRNFSTHPVRSVCFVGAGYVGKSQPSPLYIPSLFVMCVNNDLTCWCFRWTHCSRHCSSEPKDQGHRRRP